VHVRDRDLKGSAAEMRREASASDSGERVIQRRVKTGKFLLLLQYILSLLWDTGSVCSHVAWLAADPLPPRGEECRDGNGSHAEQKLTSILSGEL
jgi:hypothetical protein